MFRPVVLILLAGVAATAVVVQTARASASPAEAGTTLPPVASFTRATVRLCTLGAGTVREITELEQVNAVRHFIDRYPTGWKVPWSGPPVGRYCFDLFDHDERVDAFQVGATFVSRNFGNFYSQPISPDAVAALSKAIGIDLTAEASENAQ